jgi:hypothetical protein
LNGGTSYAGVHLVDELRKASAERIERGNHGNGKTWYEQTPQERQYFRTIRAPWWARVTKNTLDVATYHLPELFYERQASSRRCSSATGRSSAGAARSRAKT